MTSQIQFVNTKNNDRLKISILDKLEKLEQKFEWIINAKVFLKLEKYKDSIKDKLCEIDLSVPGPNIFTKSYHESYEAAIADAFTELEIQLLKHKDKLYRSIR